MRLKRQLFRPGRYVEQIGGLASHPFFRREPRGEGVSRVGTASSKPFMSRVAENAGATFSTLVSVVLIIAIGALLVAFVREIRRDTLVLDGFTAPKELVDAGYTSTVIAQQMLDESRAVQRTATTAHSRREIGSRAYREIDTSAALADIQVAAGGLSMRAIVRYARQLVDLPGNRIGGEIVDDGGTLRMVLRVEERPRNRTVEVTRSGGDVKGLLKDAGRELVRLSDPYVLASYLYDLEEPSKQFQQTLAAIDYVLANPPEDDDAWAFRLRGFVHRSQNQHDEAIADFRRALDKWPQFEPARASLATELYWSGRVKEAEALYPPSHPDRNAPVAFLLSHASALSLLNRYEEQREYRDAVVARDPTNLDAGELLANAYCYLHRYPECLATTERFSGKGSESTELPFYHAVALVKLGRAAEGLAMASDMAAAHPDYGWLILARGTALAGLNRHDDAIKDFASAKSRLPKNSEPPIRWGDSLLALGRPDEALAQMRDAVRLDPTYGGAHAGVGRALLALGKPSEAAQSFETAVKRDRHEPDALRDWAKALDMLGRKADAEEKRKLATVVEAENARPMIAAR